ncbi:hypothetical protein C0995_008093 [Termitomyces sp. Mi166|nr:hypothetical protein C0995_008093 [Termitomyces sp. Mi166\
MVSASPKSNSISTPNNHGKRSIGAVVGGVLGGVLGLAVIVATIFFFRRKRQNPPDLDLLGDTRDTNVSPSPSLREEWSARIDAAMDEAARQTERVRSRAASRTPHTSTYEGYRDTSGWQTPDTMGDKNSYGSPGRVLSPATPPPVPDIQYGSGEYLQSRGYPESGQEAESEEAADILAHDRRSSATTTTTNTSRSSSLETNEEEFELERARRREEIFERMRRVLDNSSDSDCFDSSTEDTRRTSGSANSDSGAGAEIAGDNLNYQSQLPILLHFELGFHISRLVY